MKGIQRKHQTGKRMGKRLLSLFLTVILSVTGIIWDIGNEDRTAEAATTLYSEFPASYRPYLQALHSKYPNWKFTPLNTGLDWDTVVENEMDPEVSGQGNKSTIQYVASDLSKRNLLCDFNPSTGKYIPKDSTSFFSAAKQTVAYYLNPLNFLNEVDIFQFENNAYDAEVHNLTGVQQMLKGTFMDGSVIQYFDTNGKAQEIKQSYAQVIFNAGKTYGVNPYWLASKIRQEVSADGSGSTSGDYWSKDYKTHFIGYYNFYNIGANDGADPIKNGLNYAKSAGWTTPVKAIEGGAKFFRDKYISCYQNTGKT